VLTTLKKRIHPLILHLYLAYLAIEEYIENMDKNRTKTDGFFKRTVKSISEKMNSLFIDE